MAVAEVSNLVLQPSNGVKVSDSGVKKNGNVVVFDFANKEKPEIADTLEVQGEQKTEPTPELEAAEGAVKEGSLKDQLMARKEEKTKELETKMAEYEKMKKRPISWDKLGNAVTALAPGLAMSTMAAAYIPFSGTAGAVALGAVGLLAVGAIGGLAYLGVKEWMNGDEYDKTDDFYKNQIKPLKDEIDNLTKTIAALK